MATITSLAPNNLSGANLPATITSVTPVSGSVGTYTATSVTSVPVANVVTPCVTPCGQVAPCGKPGYVMGAGLGAAFLIFLVIMTIVWVILFSFRPSFVRVINRGEIQPAPDAPADPARCFVAALIIALLIVVIVWMFRACK